MVRTVVLGLVGLAAFAGLAGFVVGWSPIDLDASLLGLATAARAPQLITALTAITWLGDALILLPVGVVAGVALSARARHPAPAVLLAMAGVGSGLAVEAIKALVGRPRPVPPLAALPVDGAGFPSGHAANSSAVYLMLAMLVGAAVGTAWVRAAVWSAALLVILAVGVSRVGLGVHAPTDVLGGWLLGLSWATLLVSGWALVTARSRANAR